MKSRVQKIEIQNFKAFGRKFSLNLEGRHLLLYGPNGSGKSSLYWALYTFFQSGRKTKAQVEKYFDVNHQEHLLNFHEQNEATPLDGNITLSIRDYESTNQRPAAISAAQHDTGASPFWEKADMASDFVTYRFFFGFSHFRNSETFNLWDLFEREILPFCITTSRGPGELESKWRDLCSDNPNPNAYSGRAGGYAFRSFNFKLKQYSDEIGNVLDVISSEAKRFYDEHFGHDDPTPLEFILEVVKPAFRNPGDKEATPPELRFQVKKGGTKIHKPQSHLNEAKMTQLALSLRFAASRVNLHQSDLRLLVIDDLLVSLDMDNRMKVVEILLSKTFTSYQKIILTHDRGFFEEFRRMIGSNHTDWCFRGLHGNPKDGIEAKNEKDALQKATDYLNGHDLEAAAVQLRIAAEKTAQSYLRMATGKTPKPGEFHLLSKNLEKAKNILMNQIPLDVFKNICAKVPESHRDKLVRINDDDIDAEPALTSDEKTLIKKQRSKLKEFMTHDAWKTLEKIETLEAVIRMKDRVLNPAAHWNETPLYNAEVKKALKLIERLKEILIT